MISPPLPLAAAPRVLIVKLSSLGDVIQTFPVVTDILHQYPDASIDWIVEEAFAPLVERLWGVHRVIRIGLRRLGVKAFLGRRTWKNTLQQAAYDFIIDAQGLTKSALVARFARLAHHGKRGSFAHRNEDCGYEWPVRWLLEHNQPVRPYRLHAITRTRLLASRLMGYAIDSPRPLPTVRFKGLPTLNPNALLPHQTLWVFIAHGTSRSDNEWPLAQWVALCQGLHAQGFSLVISQANAREQAFCTQLANAVGLVGLALTCLPSLSLSQILDEMAACVGVIGVDSGLTHLGMALDKPCVQIFQHDRAWRAGPDGSKAHQVAVGGGFKGLPLPLAPQVLHAWQTVMQHAPHQP